MSIFPRLGPACSQVLIFPEGWDKCVLQGSTIPGLCRITRGSIRLKVQRKRIKGNDGEFPTFCGMDPQPIELEIMTFDDQAREDLISIVGGLVPQPGKEPKPVSIDHPSLRVLNISTVIFTGMSALINVAPMQARMTIEMLHWLPVSKKSAVKTPKGAPVRKVTNNRTTANNPPTQNASFAAPPASLQSGG